jgi:CHAD domain-containing protein
MGIYGTNLRAASRNRTREDTGVVVTTERELKLLADADLVLPDLTDSSRGVSSGVTTHKEMTAGYYDTSTLSLARWGATLRCRDEGRGPIWTVKLPTSANGSTLSRNELNFSGPANRVPDEAAELVRGFRRGQPLKVVATLQTARQETELLLEGRVIATMCDDVVTGRVKANNPVVFREIEVELTPEVDSKSILRTIGVRLKKAGCHIERPVIAKVVRVLGPPAQLPPDVVLIHAGQRASVGDLVRSVLSSSADQLIRHDPGTRIGEDPEELHQFRVAARRLRSDLGTFAPLLDPDWATPLRDELRWIGNAAGVVRDADVLGSRLRHRTAELSNADARAATQLLDRLEHERTTGRTALLGALSSDRYNALIDAIIIATHEPRFASESIARRVARDVLPELVAKRWHRLQRAAKVLTPESPDQALHDVRILAKRCRYAAEAATRVCGGDARRFAAAISDVQELIGKHQDTVIAEDWLRAAAEATPSTGLVAGLAIAQERSERARCRQELLTSIWPATNRKSLHSWLD